MPAQLISASREPWQREKRLRQCSHSMSQSAISCGFRFYPVQHIIHCVEPRTLRAFCKCLGTQDIRILETSILQNLSAKLL